MDPVGDGRIVELLGSCVGFMLVTKLLDSCNHELSMMRGQCPRYSTILGYELGYEFPTMCKPIFSLWLEILSLEVVSSSICVVLGLKWEPCKPNKKELSPQS